MGCALICIRHRRDNKAGQWSLQQGLYKGSCGQLAPTASGAGAGALAVSGLQSRGGRGRAAHFGASAVVAALADRGAGAGAYPTVGLGQVYVHSSA